MCETRVWVWACFRARWWESLGVRGLCPYLCVTKTRATNVAHRADQERSYGDRRAFLKPKLSARQITRIKCPSLARKLVTMGPAL